MTKQYSPRGYWLTNDTTDTYLFGRRAYDPDTCGECGLAARQDTATGLYVHVVNGSEECPQPHQLGDN